MVNIKFLKTDRQNIPACMVSSVSIFTGLSTLCTSRPLPFKIMLPLIASFSKAPTLVVKTSTSLPSRCVVVSKCLIYSSARVKIAAFPYFCCAVFESMSSASESSASSSDLLSALDRLLNEGMPKRRQLILSLRFVRYLFSIALWPLFRD